MEIFIEELNTINFKFNVICLQESWKTDNSDLSQIQLPGYHCIIQGTRCSEKGGLVIYIDTRFKYEVLINLNEYEYWEGQIIKVTGGGLPKEIIIGNIYRPPRVLHDQIRQFINELTVLMTNIENKIEVILAGDYNLNLLKINENEACSDFFEMLTTHSFYPQITLPTRFCYTTGTFIDNFFLKKKKKQSTKTKVGILLKTLSDHQPYFILFDMAINKEATPKCIQINVQTEKAMTQVNNEINASEIYNKLDKSRSADTNMNYDIIHDAILIAREKHMPCKLVNFLKYKRKKSKWITQ